MDMFNESAVEQGAHGNDSVRIEMPNWWLFTFQLSIAIISIPLEVLILLLIKLQFVHRPHLVLIVGFTVGNLLVSCGMICSSTYRFGQRQTFDANATLTVGECFVKYLHGPIVRFGQDLLVTNILLLAIDRLVVFAYAHRPRMLQASLFLRLELLCVIVATCDMLGMFVIVMRRANERVSSLCFLSQVLGKFYMNVLIFFNITIGCMTIICYACTFVLWCRQRKQVVGKDSALKSLQFRRESTVMRSLVVVFILVLFTHIAPWLISPWTKTSSITSKMIVSLNLLSKPLNSIAYITVHPHLRRQFGIVALSFKLVRNVKEWMVRRKTYVVYLGVR
ncbi:hypothetical protein D918_08791 [Trichuris suis]|nr:hypothetical protein D918_08791 [Trichuris suis]